MTKSQVRLSELRAGLVQAVQAARTAERAVFAALDPSRRDLPPAGGGWSAKDTLAHLSAWRQRQTDKLAARREGRPEPPLPAAETAAVNAIFHAERARWPWDRVSADAEATAEALVAELWVADHAIADPMIVGSIMADGPEHDLDHLAQLSQPVGPGSQVLELAATTAAIVDRGGWRSRPAAYARYNLACFYAKAGRLDEARSLLRLALPAEEPLRAHPPEDDDLIALRDEIPGLAAG